MPVAPWTQDIGRLRRRATVQGALDGFGQAALPVAALALATLGGSQLSPWLRFFAPYVGVALAFALAAAPIWGAIRARRSELYFAKWIDVASKLEDRLASAVEWSAIAEPDPFRKRCVELLTLELGAGRRKLVQPSTRPRRLGLSLLATLVMAGTVLLYLRQPPRVYEADAREKVSLPAEVAARARANAQAVADQAKSLASPELERMASDLETLMRSMEDGKLDRAEALARIEEVKRRASSIGRQGAALDAAASSPGPVGALARAAARGDVKGAAQTLARLAQMAQAGELSDQDLTELAGTLSALADLDRSGGGALVESLRGAERAVKAGDLAGAARAMSAAAGRFESLRPALTERQAARATDRLAELLEHAARDLPGDAAPGQSAAGQKLGEGGGESGSSDRGTEQGGARTPGERPEDNQGPALAIGASWHGKLFKQLIDSGSGAGRGDQLKESFAEHQRVVEDRFQHDEVPEEYAEAVRAYFAKLNERESTWTSTKK